MQEIQILLFDGFDELDAVAPYELFADAGFEVALVTARPAPRVTAAHGMTVEPQGVLAPAPDLLLVPGGGWITRSEQGAWGEAQRGVLPSAIAACHGAGSVVAGVCSGVMLLAQAGLLRGRPAVTHHGALEDLRAAGADVRPDARVVDDGDVLTAGGVTSAIDLALHVIERERGAQAAADGARRVEYERRPPVLAAE